MKLVISETGEAKELNIIDNNGTNWTQDLIGNSGATEDWDYSEDEQAYIISQDDFDWWEDYIAKKQADDDRLAELRQEYDSNEIQEIIDEEFQGIHNGYEQEHDVMQVIFERVAKELSK